MLQRTKVHLRLLLAILAGIVAGGAVATGVAFAVWGTGDDGNDGSGLVTGDLRQKIHEHANFALFIRGEKFDFGKPEFISYAGKEKSPNVHIHEPRFGVVHVHREQTTWDEFFRSLGFELTDPTFGVDVSKTCLKMPAGEKLCNNDRETFKFVVNAVRVDGISLETIGQLNRVLISYGSESDEEVMRQYAQVGDDACIPAGVCEARGSGSGEHGEPEPCSVEGGQCN